MTPEGSGLSSPPCFSKPRLSWKPRGATTAVSTHISTSATRHCHMLGTHTPSDSIGLVQDPLFTGKTSLSLLTEAKTFPELQTACSLRKLRPVIFFIFRDQKELS